ncbi:Fatty acid desaturase 2, partial [Clarias magur]
CYWRHVGTSDLFSHCQPAAGCSDGELIKPSAQLSETSRGGRTQEGAPHEKEQ